MSKAAQRVLIVGGGFSGMAAAIQLRKSNLQVDLVEISREWSSYGAGITLGGASLRALKSLSVLEEFLRRGFAGDGLDLIAPNGHPIGRVPTPRVAGPDVPGGAAIMRPVLAHIMSEATRASGTRVLLDCTFQSLQQRANGVQVTLTNGESGLYDLVIGADGVNSKVRAAIFPAAAGPAYSGQGVWRAVLPRPSGLDTPRMWLGGPVKPGVSPVSASHMYMYVTENRAQRSKVDAAEFPALLAALLEGFTDPMLVEIRKSLGANSQIVYRPLEGLLLPLPWHAGHIVLIGDAIHATTPHLASGACIGMEDAIVLAEEVGRPVALQAALESFERRRWERCRMVVQNSLRLGQIEIESGDMKEHAGIMRDSIMSLSSPI
jgi:2-polyprenyl-6-methoxyphenol hydroxylase-like FAD-dependent oxidoreductase